MVENRTADIIQETRKHIKKKPPSSATQNPAQNSQSPVQTDLELQLKASRDVRSATVLVHIRSIYMWVPLLHMLAIQNMTHLALLSWY